MPTVILAWAESLFSLALLREVAAGAGETTGRLCPGGG